MENNQAKVQHSVGCQLAIIISCSPPQADEAVTCFDKAVVQEYTHMEAFHHPERNHVGDISIQSRIALYGKRDLEHFDISLVQQPLAASAPTASMKFLAYLRYYSGSHRRIVSPFGHHRLISGVLTTQSA